MVQAPIDAHDILACPVDGDALDVEGDWLCCGAGHRYPVVDGVAVLLRTDVVQTLGVAGSSLEAARRWCEGDRSDPMFIDTLGISEEERKGVRAAIGQDSSGIDPVASFLVGATNGILYKPLIGKLAQLPVPELRLPKVSSARLLDVGCNWGRWSLAAAAKGYRPVGIDPSLGAVLAARRLARMRGLPFEGVVGDARHLPFKCRSFDSAFSYSVLQHFSKANARQAVREIGRVVRQDGTIRIQMASACGIRSLQHIVQRGFSEPQGFEVRYWLPGKLTKDFREILGNVDLEVDCFFGLGLQPTDRELYSPLGKVLISLSEKLRWAAKSFVPLRYLADSVYLVSGNTFPIAREDGSQ